MRIDDEWYLVDCCLGAGYVVDNVKFVKRYSDIYFAAKPCQFILKHFPLDDHWQCIAPTVRLPEFKELQFFSEEFLSRGLLPANYEASICNIVVDHCHLQLSFHVPIDQDEFIVDIQCPGFSFNYDFVTQYVRQNQVDGIRHVHILFPHKTTYKVRLMLFKPSPIENATVYSVKVNQGLMYEVALNSFLNSPPNSHFQVVSPIQDILQLNSKVTFVVKANPLLYKSVAIFVLDRRKAVLEKHHDDTFSGQVLLECTRKVRTPIVFVKLLPHEDPYKKKSWIMVAAYECVKQIVEKFNKEKIVLVSSPKFEDIVTVSLNASSAYSNASELEYQDSEPNEPVVNQSIMHNRGLELVSPTTYKLKSETGTPLFISLSSTYFEDAELSCEIMQYGRVLLRQQYVFGDEESQLLSFVLHLPVEGKYCACIYSKNELIVQYSVVVTRSREEQDTSSWFLVSSIDKPVIVLSPRLHELPAPYLGVCNLSFLTEMKRHESKLDTKEQLCIIFSLFKGEYIGFKSISDIQKVNTSQLREQIASIAASAGKPASVTLLSHLSSLIETDQSHIKISIQNPEHFKLATSLYALCKQIDSTMMHIEKCDAMYHVHVMFPTAGTYKLVIRSSFNSQTFDVATYWVKCTIGKLQQISPPNLFGFVRILTDNVQFHICSPVFRFLNNQDAHHFKVIVSDPAERVYVSCGLEHYPLLQNKNNSALWEDTLQVSKDVNYREAILIIVRKMDPNIIYSVSSWFIRPCNDS